MDTEEMRKLIEEEVRKRENVIKVKMEEEYARKYEAIKQDILQVVEESVQKITALASKAIDLASGSSSLVQKETQEIQLTDSDSDDEPTKIVQSPSTQAKSQVQGKKLAQVRFNPVTETMFDFENRFKTLVKDIQNYSKAETSEPSISNVCTRIAEEAWHPRLALEKKKNELNQLVNMMANDGLIQQADPNTSFSFKASSTKKRKMLGSFGGGTAAKVLNIVCYHCGSRGHARKDCRMPSRMCYNCNSYGHISRDCDQPASASSRRARSGQSNGAT